MVKKNKTVRQHLKTKTNDKSKLLKKQTKTQIWTYMWAEKSLIQTQDVILTDKVIFQLQMSHMFVMCL